jgi:hypothetical protein
VYLLVNNRPLRVQIALIGAGFFIYRLVWQAPNGAMCTTNIDAKKKSEGCVTNCFALAALIEYPFRLAILS